MENPTTRLLWWALAASLALYVVVAHAVDLGREPDVPMAILLPVFAVVSIGLGVGTLVFRRKALVEPIQAGRLDPATPEGFARAFPLLLTTWVLSESVGIFGLVLSLLSGEPLYAVVFAAGGLFLLHQHRPGAPELARSRSWPPV